MAVRSSMAALIARVRVLINDAAGVAQIFDDQTIQDIMDESRIDLRSVLLKPIPTFTNTTVSYLDYYSNPGQANWEDDVVLKQYLMNVVTPATSENIVGHWTFAATTLPPVYATGKSYDVYRTAADLLERWAAKWTLAYTFSSDGQSFQRSQVLTNLITLAASYRQKQRAHVIGVTRSDIAGNTIVKSGLGPVDLDYYGSGDGR